MLRQHMAYTTALIARSAAPPKIQWSPTLDSISYLDITLYLGHFREGLNDLLTLAEQSITAVTGGHIQANVPASFAENMSNTSNQYSWLNESPFLNQYLPVLKHLMNDQSHPIADITADHQFHWRKADCMQFMQKMGDLNKILSVLCYILPSQAPRGSEFVDTRIRNSDNLRNVFYSHGLWFISQRLKTSGLTESHDFIPMLCPPRLEKILCNYLILLRPIEVLLADICWGSAVKALYQEFLYVSSGKRITSDMFGKILELHTSTYMKCEMGRRPYRHISIAIKREFIPPMYHGMIVNEIGDLSAGHSSHQARHTYAQEYGSLPWLTTDRLFDCRKFSEAWHDVLGIGSNPIPMPIRNTSHYKHQAIPTVQSISATTASSPSAISAQQSPIIPSAMDQDQLQAFIGTTVNNSIATAMMAHDAKIEKSIQQAVVAGIAELLMRQQNMQSQGISLQGPQPPSTLSTSISAQPISTANQRSSQLPVTEVHSVSQASLVQPIHSTNNRPSTLHSNTIISSSLHTSSATLLQLLAKTLKTPNAQFKSVTQKKMVQYAVERNQSFIAVLPTGGGKSAAWEVPIQGNNEKDMTTVVLSPFVSLTADMQRRANANKTTNIVWKSAGKQRDGQYQLLFASYDHVKVPSFKGYV